jgi:death-on-curing protein
MRYLTVDELIYMSEQLPNSDKIHTIVQGKRKVRDMGLLEAAVGRPMQTVFGEDAYPTPQEKAAALLHSLARNHPFADGNKRTATIAVIFMLAVNGLHVNWDAHEALAQIMDMAEGKQDVTDFAAWLPTIPGEPSPEQNAEADMRLIEQIIRDHGWLLEQLAAR